MPKILKNIDKLIRRTMRVVEPPISKLGTEANVLRSKGISGISSAKDFTNNNLPEILTPSTVVISDGYGIWKLKLRKDTLKMLCDTVSR
jgi:hypothetical protein